MDGNRRKLGRRAVEGRQLAYYICKQSRFWSPVISGETGLLFAIIISAYEEAAKDMGRMSDDAKAFLLSRDRFGPFLDLIEVDPDWALTATKKWIRMMGSRKIVSVERRKAEKRVKNEEIKLFEHSY